MQDFPQSEPHQTTPSVSTLLLPYVPITREIVEGILAEHDLREIQDGVIHDDRGEEKYTWQQIKRSPGKQQAVGLIDVTTLSGVRHKMVIRRGKKEFGELYHAYPFIRTTFPRLYTSFPIEDPSNNNWMYSLERIEGYEEKKDVDEYTRFINNPESFARLCAWLGELLDDILENPILITDFVPSIGHNCIYNTVTNGFQLFDIDTVGLYDSDPLYRGLYFIDGLIRSTDPNSVKIGFFLFKKLYEKYGESITKEQKGEVLQPSYRAEYVRKRGDRELSSLYGEHESCYTLKRIAVEDPLYSPVSQTLGIQPGNPEIVIHVMCGYPTLCINNNFLPSIKEDDFASFDALIKSGKKILKKGYDIQTVRNAESAVGEFFQNEARKKALTKHFSQTAWGTVAS